MTSPLTVALSAAWIRPPPRQTAAARAGIHMLLFISYLRDRAETFGNASAPDGGRLAQPPRVLRCLLFGVVMPQNPPISVIVPALNEQGRIARCLESLARTLPGAEILVVDGGSGDRTREIAGRFEGAGVRFLAAPPGRGPQMNAGAAASAGSVLLFAHADVVLP